MDLDKIEFLKDKLRQLEYSLGWEFGLQTECCGVTLSQRLVLIEIGKREKVTLIELSKRLGLDSSTLSRTINGMVNIGLVNRILNPEDRRYVLITLTQQGRAVYHRIQKMSTQYFTDILRHIPKEKQSEVIDAVGLLVDAIWENNESKRKIKNVNLNEESNDKEK